MIINCPDCKSELEFPEESVGANVRCGACGIKFASLDAIYAKGMECRGIAQKSHDEGKENESMEAWAIAYQYFLLAGGGGHADAQYQGRWIYEHGLGAKKSEEVQQGGEIVRTIQERAFAAIKESFRLVGRCIVELDHVERGTAFTRYVLKSSEEEKFRRVFYSRAKSEDLAETIGNKLGKLGVKADSSCSVYIPAEGVERLSFWEVIAGVEGKIQPFFGEDRRSQYEFWEMCKGRGEMHMQDIAYALPYVSAVGTVISPAALSGGIHIILGDHGSGKTTCLNAAICTLALFRPSSCVRIAVLDPVGEMPEYAGLPHLSYGGTVIGYENCKRTLRRICNEIEWREQTIREYSSSLRPDVNLKLLSAGGDAIPLYAVFIDNLDALVRLGDKEIFDCLAKLSCAWHEGFYTVATSKNFSRSVFKVPHACGYVDWCMMFSMSISDAKAYNLCSLSELAGARKSNVPGAIFGASSYPKVGVQATFITKEDVAEVIAIARSQDKERAFRKRMGRSFGKDGQESPESPAGVYHH